MTDMTLDMDMTIDTVSADGCDRAAVRAVRGDLPGGGPRQLHRHLHRLHQQAHAGQPGWILSTLFCSAVKRSIGSTTSFHNHGEGPY